MTQLLVKIAAKFNTSLNLKTAIGATSATLDSATDDSGVALPTGRYALTIDGGTSSEEFITCTLTSTALTNIKHVTMQGVETSGTTIVHRKGATVKITDFAVIKKMLDLLDGTTDFDSATVLGYDGAPTLTTGSNEFATVKYADDLAIAGSPKATNSTYGISKLSVAAVDSNIPIVVGDNDGRVPTQTENDALAGTSGTPSSTNKYVTNDDTATAATASKVARRLAGGNITVVTESQANNSTNAASTAYVDTGLASVANVFDTVIFTRDVSTATGTQVVNHSLGKTPKMITFINQHIVNFSGSTPQQNSFGTWDGTDNKGSYWSSSADYGNTTNAIYGNYTSGSASYAGVVTAADSTTFTITWTKQGSPTGTFNILATLIA